MSIERTSKDELFHGGLEILRPLSDAVDAYDAMSIWWADRLLGGTRDIEKLSSEAIPLYPHIGGFALTLARLARAQELEVIETTVRPAQILRDAAMISRLPIKEPLRENGGPSTFPPHNLTQVDRGVVFAAVGPNMPPRQIWPIQPAQPLRAMLDA